MPEDENNSASLAGNAATATPSPRLELMCRLWREALEVESVGLDDDFFALGGDSLTVARIAVLAAAEGVRIDPNLFTQYRTIREFENGLKAAE
ncbi:MAG: hypothetical protein LAP21_05425 [Acidobacteriia bacterium]|nr:hypothetical protein [Terriglobia bacterium]